MIARPHRPRLVAALSVLSTTVLVYGQSNLSSSISPWAANIVVPQSRVLASHPSSAVQVTEVTAGVVILEQVATTTMDIQLRNPTGSRVEAELVVPVPQGAVLRSFTFEGKASEPTFQVLPADEARKTYQAIVARTRDPALLEFLGCNLIRSSVFPIDARGTQKIRLTYEHLLTTDGDRVDYILPRSESLDYCVPWKVSVNITSNRPISTVYSPSHKIETVRRGPGGLSVRITDGAKTEPGPFRLSYLLERSEVTASLLAYPDTKVGGGYFMLLAGLPAQPNRGSSTQPAIRREITLVLDRSGSMNGKKIEQVKEVARQIISALQEGEAFSLITYNESVEMLANQPLLSTDTNVQKAREYIDRIRAGGGTNLHAALTEALRLKPREGTLPITLFLTDGLPTVGQTSETAIREVAIHANPYQRRVFTFGVGLDVNTPLLERIAAETRAAPTFVLPSEDVEVKVAGVFKRLTGPVLADPKIQISESSDKPGFNRVHDLLPNRLPDMFAGDQLVLFGQYNGGDPLTFKLTGNYLGKARTFTFTFGLDKSTTKNAFVPRLWASRRIAVLIDAIRQLGADPKPGSAHATASVDPKVKELTDEIVRLSTEFGILTEYTAFLAREGTDLSNRDNVLSQATFNFDQRAMRTRSGIGAVNQSFNADFMNNQMFTNTRNVFYDERMNRVSITNVQQVNDRAFYNRNGRWVDSRVVEREKEIKPTKVIEFGSEEFTRLAERLASEGRQGSISLKGEILLMVGNETVLVK